MDYRTMVYTGFIKQKMREIGWNKQQKQNKTEGKEKEIDTVRSRKTVICLSGLKKGHMREIQQETEQTCLDFYTESF